MIISFAANILLAIGSLLVLPARVAIHFGFGGYPDSWASKYIVILILLIVEVPLFLIFFFTPSLVVKTPQRFINLPNKDYWFREENKPVMKAKIESIMSGFGAAFFVWFFVVNILCISANLHEPVRLNEIPFLTALVAFFIYTIYWCVKFFRAFSLPSNNKEKGI
jgi:uncharacterized membrane protein